MNDAAKKQFRRDIKEERDYLTDYKAELLLIARDGVDLYAVGTAQLSGMSSGLTDIAKRACGLVAAELFLQEYERIDRQTKARGKK